MEAAASMRGRRVPSRFYGIPNWLRFPPAVFAVARRPIGRAYLSPKPASAEGKLATATYRTQVRPAKTPAPAHYTCSGRCTPGDSKATPRPPYLRCTRWAHHSNVAHPASAGPRGAPPASAGERANQTWARARAAPGRKKWPTPPTPTSTTWTSTIPTGASPSLPI